MCALVQSPGTPGPSRKAPDLEVQGLSDNLEHSLGPTVCQQACQGADLILGFNVCKEFNKADKNTIQQNIAVLHGLLNFNTGGIYRKAQLKEAFHCLDVKHRCQMSTSSKDKVEWAEQQATVIHFCFQELRRMVRNLKNMTRTPAWLTQLLNLVAKSNLASTSPLASPRDCVLNKFEAISARRRASVHAHKLDRPPS